jgi:hypothetical protein
MKIGSFENLPIIPAPKKEENHGGTETQRQPWNPNSMNIDGQDRQDKNRNI